jgi:hypothetical protein
LHRQAIIPYLPLFCRARPSSGRQHKDLSTNISQFAQLPPAVKSLTKMCEYGQVLLSIRHIHIHSLCTTRPYSRVLPLKSWILAAQHQLKEMPILLECRSVYTPMVAIGFASMVLLVNISDMTPKLKNRHLNMTQRYRLESD